MGDCYKNFVSPFANALGDTFVSGKIANEYLLVRNDRMAFRLPVIPSMGNAPAWWKMPPAWEMLIFQSLPKKLAYVKQYLG
ncbi:MAG: hypothetical protein J6V99_05500 [Neisseriaceae bacterium]|nr:hypothetical protein [Neisseriaceae bacterium]